MKNFVTPHCHPQSLDSASTVEKMIKREVELGTGYATCTDHGTMEACLNHYDLSKKHGVKPILGIEAYFRDDNCSILDKAGLLTKLEKKIRGGNPEQIKDKWSGDYLKYFHVTMHFMDQKAYLKGAKILSNASLTNYEQHGSKSKALFTWNDLEEIGSENVTFCSSCLVGMVQRHLMVGRADLAEAYYQRLRAMVKPGHFYVEAFPHRCTHNWENKVVLHTDKGELIKVWPKKKLMIDGEDVYAQDFSASFNRKRKKKPVTLDGIYHYRKLHEDKKQIVLVERRKDFFRNDIEPLQPEGDIQFKGNLFVLAMAEKYKDPIIISDDSHYAYPGEKLVQDARLGNGKDDWKFHGYYYRMDTKQAAGYFSKYLKKDEKTIERWIDNSYEWASKFDNFELNFDLKLPVKFYEGDHIVRLGKLIEKHGRFDKNNPEMVQRLKKEVSMLTNNGKIDLLPYFFPLEETVDIYQQNGLLTGPGRGSAAGLLMSYLIGITHVDPLKYGLSMERFITIDRIRAGTLPDIDQDLEDRELLVGVDGKSGWLNERFGSEHVAQISTDTMLRLKSSIKDVHRAFGKLTPDIENICKRLPNPKQGISDYDQIHGKYDDDGGVITKGLINKDDPTKTNPALREYMGNYPEEWKIVEGMIGIPRQKSRHACAFVIADEPISDYIPLTLISGIPVTQYTAKSVEKAGGIKVDFLVVNSLKDIRNCLDLIKERVFQGAKLPDFATIDNKKVPKVRVLPLIDPLSSSGLDVKELVDIWALPEDQEVFKDICGCRTETVFQLGTPTATGYLEKFNDNEGNHLIQSIEDISTFTSLGRPGALDFKIEGTNRNMMDEYIERKKGFIDKGSAFVEYLYNLLPETLGVLVYQEQLQKVVEQLGGFDPLEANQFRINVSKKKKVDLAEMKPKFIEGAITQISREEAEKIWGMMVTFGQYGFNKSHAICYSTIAYACAYLKHFYPKKWWCAVLRNAKKDEIYGEFFKYCRDMVQLPDINKSGDDFIIRDDMIVAPIGMAEGIGAKTHEAISKGRPYKDIVDFVERTKKLNNNRRLNKTLVNKLVYSGIMDSLFPEEYTALERLSDYAKALRDTGMDKKATVPIIYMEMTPMQKYCIRKSIVPAYATKTGESLLELFVKMAPTEALYSTYDLFEHQGAIYGTNGNYQYKLIGPKFFKTLDMNPELTGDYLVLGFVVDERKFPYRNNSKEGLQISFDTDGHTSKAAMWPFGEDRKPVVDLGVPNKKLKHSIVLLYLSRYKAYGNFAIKRIKFVCDVPEEKEKK